MNGLLYTASFENKALVTGAIENIWEMVAAAGVAVLVYGFRFTIKPTITSGIAQDERLRIAIQTISTTGTGGTAATPAAVNPRNTVAAATTCNYLVTTPGTAGTILMADEQSVIIPYEREFQPDRRIPIAAGGRLALALLAVPSTAYSISGEVVFEER